MSSTSTIDHAACLDEVVRQALPQIEQRLGGGKLERWLGRGTYGRVAAFRVPRVGAQTQIGIALSQVAYAQRNAGRLGVVAVKIDAVDEHDDEEIEMFRHATRALRVFACDPAYRYFARCFGGFELTGFETQGQTWMAAVTVMEAYAGTSDEVLDRHRVHGAARSNQIALWTVQLITALNFMHSHAACPMMHRDVKPDNLLVSATDGSIALTDFGCARPCAQAEISWLSGASSDRVRHFGSAVFLPPEAHRDVAVGPSCDVWAVGMTVAYLHLGRARVAAAFGRNKPDAAADRGSSLHGVKTCARAQMRGADEQRSGRAACPGRLRERRRLRGRGP